MYPDKAQLHPKDPYAKHKQRLLVETVGSAVSTQITCDNSMHKLMIKTITMSQWLDQHASNESIIALMAEHHI